MGVKSETFQHPWRNLRLKYAKSVAVAGLVAVGMSSAVVASASPAQAIYFGSNSPDLGGQVQVSSKLECTGSLIGTEWVLTAKHCVEGGNWATSSVRIGSLQTGQGTVFALKTPSGADQPWVLHPESDVALLRLSRAVDPSLMRPIAYSSNYPRTGQLATLRGWGVINDGNTRPTTLQVANFKVLSPVRGPGDTTPAVDASVGPAANSMDLAPAVNPYTRSGLGDSGGGYIINNALCGVQSTHVTEYPTAPVERDVAISTGAVGAWIRQTSNIYPDPYASCAPPPQDPQRLRVMAMGGKITDGQGVGSGNSFRKGTKDRVMAAAAAGSLPVSAFDYVGKNRQGSMADNETEGYSGMPIQQLGDQMNCEVSYYRPNVVLMEMGTEDMESAISVSRAPARVGAVITKTLMRAPEATVLVGTLPRSTKAALQSRISAFNDQLVAEVARQQAADRHVRLVDMGVVGAADVSGDGVLPSAAGYDKMAGAFYDAITAASKDGWIKAPAADGDRTYCGVLRPRAPLPAPTVGRTNIRQPDPSTILVGGTYYSVVSDLDPDPANGYERIYVRAASTLEGLDAATPQLVWSDSGVGAVWAPEIEHIDGRYYIYFAMGPEAAHRMYVISSTDPQTGYGTEQKMNLPDDRFAIDGASFVFGNQRYFVWSGWEGTTNEEQNLYLAKMDSPTSTTGGRAIISQPREAFERVVGKPFVNEAPQPIKDPSGQLHVVYSANGSWSGQYCLTDLRLKAGGDPMSVWDWYKSNGCLFGSNAATMMSGWDPTLFVDGPGHHSFVLPEGDINNSPPAIKTFPTMYHGYPKGVAYDWPNRVQYIGGALWWGNCTYSRKNVPGDAATTGWSLKFFEDRNAGGGNGGSCAPPPSPGQSTIKAADPSVIRVGGTYYSVESDGGNIYSRSAGSVAALGDSAKSLIWSAPKNMPNVWAPELALMATSGSTRFYGIYFASGDGKGGQRMYYTQSTSPDRGYSDPVKVNLPDDKWAVDGTSFSFNNSLWFVWSGWEGDTNGEQNLYIAKMSGSSFTNITGKRYIISQPRESWERIVGDPFINEAPEAIKDPNGQLHIVYSANGSWSDQYCLADLRLKAGGDPTAVWDWYKSNGCLFGSNKATMMTGWDPTLFVNGPGHNSFVLLDGNIGTSPPAGPAFPLMFHGVPKGTGYTPANRIWYSGSFRWWGDTTYSRQYVPGDTSNTGYSLKFFE